MLKLSDIATRAGVSPTTVSFVLNGKQSENVRISDKTRAKVLEAAEEMGYRHNQLARAMRTGNSRMIGVLGGDLSEHHVGHMMTGVIEAADDQGYTVKILRFDTFGGDPKQVIRRSSEFRLTGVLALHLPASVLEDLRSEATNYGYPLVLMDTRIEDKTSFQVMSDDYRGVDSGVEHLVKLGHTKIAFMSSVNIHSPFSMAREHAFLDAMKCRSLPVPSNYIERGSVSLNQRHVSMEAARRLFTLPVQERPTAIFCSSDIMALATLQVAVELGIHIPKEVSIVGFANLPVCEFVSPLLTTIEQPFQDIGRVATRILLANIQHKDQDTEVTSANGVVADTAMVDNGVHAGVTLLPTRLVERASTAPPNRLM